MQLNSAEWWETKAQKYIGKSDARDRPGEGRIAAQLVTGSVLELGSAFGHFSSYLPKSTQYLGIDISEVLVTEARKNYPDRVFVQANVTKFSLRQWAKCVDHVCAFQVLEHFTSEDLHSLLKILAGISRKSLIFSVPRGKPGPSARKNDGHLIGWTDEEELSKEFSKYGEVSFWAGADNHICGELKWS